ncbi:50S ribosomal protein L3 [Candidatus Phytoplasma phoenicium]|uniref:Large ribosomal subunit protein uL3 n=1 Tax=Candidatus Phytoplasma phoenicium TaxID=198422 RepID=A0A0L0MJG9_9MOLU|nr:50S ribosomal protein L3 [Candidatus Phytoplasma phoenicium]KND62792.1 50S ribosomal protein L3 [Candidatus Phytoplasma phoenicium]
MAKGILGRKLGMTQVFDEKGFSIPVTVVDVSENTIIQHKTLEKDGYQAVQLGFGTKKNTKTSKPLKGHFDKAQTHPKVFLKEISFASNIQNEMSMLGVGSLKNLLFQPGDLVDVTSISKGKGFQGSIKRHNQSKGPETHGSRYHRRPGSMGPIKGNIKGKNLPGQMGFQQVTLQNLKIVSIKNDEKKLFLIKGSIPGPKKRLVLIKSAVKTIMGEKNHASVKFV